MSQSIVRKQNRRKLRKCDNFKRGKCAECDDKTAERVGCDMRKGSKEPDRKSE